MEVYPLIRRVLKEKQSGFTLIELLIVIVMLGVLLIGLIATFNPLAQYNKARDGQREHDLGQIQRALDSYFSDTGCYPISLTFNAIWSVNGQVYMEKVPQDPDCLTNANKCYRYEVPSGACPQWNVLYAALRGSVIPANACSLEIKNQSMSCLPTGYHGSGYNLCDVSGSVDCTAVAGFSLVAPGGGNGGNGGNGGGGGGSGTPTATPTPLNCPADAYYGCTGDNRCNSIFPKTQCTDFGGQVQCYCDRHCNQSCQFN